jgi:hypothetical protein
LGKVLRPQPATDRSASDHALAKEFEPRAKPWPQDSFESDNGNPQFDLLKSRNPSEMSDLKKLVAEIGMVEVGQDEYDIPTFLRKQAD